MKESSTNVRSWAQFDNACLFRTYTGRDSNPLLADSRGPEDTDVTETDRRALRDDDLLARSWAACRSAATPACAMSAPRWNRPAIARPVTVTPSVGGSVATIVTVPALLSEIQGEGDYDYWLPSLNVNFDLNEKTRLRLAGSRAISRSGIEEFNVGITPVVDATATTVEGVLANSTTGNPNLKPLESWNLDASLEFYLNRDTAFSVATYYKWIKNAAFDAVQPFTTSIIANGSLVDLQRRGPGQRPGDAPPLRLRVHRQLRLQHPARPLGRHGRDGWATTTPRPISNSPIRRPSRPMSSRPTCAACRSTTSTARSIGKASGCSLRASYRYRSDYSKPNSGTNRSVRGSGYPEPFGPVRPDQEHPAEAAGAERHQRARHHVQGRRGLDHRGQREPGTRRVLFSLKRSK
jgi:iron complex outermembrane receptor protein